NRWRPVRKGNQIMLMHWWKNRVRRPRRHANARPFRARLQLEWLEDRRLLTAGITSSFGDLRPEQFGSEEAFKQLLIDQAVQQYSGLFGYSFDGGAAVNLHGALPFTA